MWLRCFMDFYGVLEVILFVHFCCFTDFNSLLLPILTACMAGHSHINICNNNNNNNKEKYTVLVRWDMGLAWLPSWQWDHNWVRRCTYHLLWIVTTHEYIYIYPTTKPWLPSISMSIPCLPMFIHSVPPLTNYLHHPIPALSTGGWQSELQRFLVAWDEDGPPSMAFSTAICAAMGRQQAALQVEIRRCRKR